ncbi:MAG: serine/threonine-protein kinase [Acidobacteriota bacterium]|nr:serine/threonine-protein kinase [Acidobacteriota bacterium]
MRECPRCETCYEDNTLVCPQDNSNTKSTLPGPSLLSNRYLLQKRLGRGAMGQVYLARDQNLQTRQVAVKTVRPDILVDEDLQEGEAVARFEREARSAASIRHPNVVDVTDFGQSSEGVLFLVMEYVEGETLHQLLRREGTLGLQRTAAIMQQVVAGVDAAHDAGILHRDLKPANIFIMHARKKASGSSQSGAEDGFIKVGDFGLAKIVRDDNSETTASGPASRGILGTPEYMAPEQMQPGFKLDARADIYALASIAYHMLGGRPPYVGDITQLIAQKLTQPPQPLTSLRSDISAEVEGAVMRGLARDLNDRPPTAVDWFEEFHDAIGDQSSRHLERESRLVILAPSGSEVYVDDERHGSVGRSGRMILSAMAPGRHVLRVARSGENDDERVIEVRPDGAEQIIQAQFKSETSSNPLSPSQGGSLDSRTGAHSSVPAVVVCTRCQARFAAGAKFCGRCGNTNFERISEPLVVLPASQAEIVTCPRCSSRYPPFTKFCGKCGIPIGTVPIDWKTPKPVEVFCSTCGSSYNATTKFCGRCGTAIKA